jgi:hypothetical protein
VIVEPSDLRTALTRACSHAGLDPAAFVVWIVDATRPPGSTPLAYLQPAGEVRDDSVLVFRAVGAERARAYARKAHRIAVWRNLPGIPDVALGPMIRHELAHARRWEESGTAFYEADERLRSAVDGASYAQLPTEREANADAAAYARESLADVDLARLATVPALAELLAGRPAGDVVAETLALLGERVAVVPERLEPGADMLVELVEPAVAASGGMP